MSLFDDSDSWLAGIGVDVQGIMGSVQQTATAVMEDVKSAGAAVFEQAQGAVSAAAAAVTGGAPATKPAAPAGKSASSSGKPSTVSTLRGSVGQGGTNNPEDVKAVQAALKIAVDGDCGGGTIGAIKAFQKSIGQANPDGRIDPGGATAKALAGGANGAATPTPAPNGEEDDGFLGGLKKKIVGALEDGLPGGLPDGVGAAGVVGAVLPGLPIPGLPGLPGGVPGIGPFPKLPGEGGGFGKGPGGGFSRPPSAGGGTSGASGIATKAVGEAGQIAMEGIALFDALLMGGLIVVGGGVIVGLGMEVYSSEVIAALPGDVDKVTATMVAGYRTAMQNGPQPSDDAGKVGWLLGHDIFVKMRSELKKKNPDATDEKILAAIAGNADKGAAAAEPILRNKAQEAVWISYASKHQDTRWTTYLNERHRAWSKIFGSAPQGNEKLWKQFLNEHSNTSSPLAGAGGDKDPRSAPGAKNGGPAIDPKTGQPIVAPGTDDNRTVSDPSQVDPAEAPSGGNDDPAEFSQSVLSDKKLANPEASVQVREKNQKARALVPDEIRMAKQIAAVLDEVNGKTRTIDSAKDFFRRTPVYRYKEEMNGEYRGWHELTLVGPEASGGPGSLMRLLFAYDATREKVHSVRIVQMHPQPR